MFIYRYFPTHSHACLLAMLLTTVFSLWAEDGVKPQPIKPLPLINPVEPLAPKPDNTWGVAKEHEESPTDTDESDSGKAKKENGKASASTGTSTNTTQPSPSSSNSNQGTWQLPTEVSDSGEAPVRTPSASEIVQKQGQQPAYSALLQKAVDKQNNDPKKYKEKPEKLVQLYQAVVDEEPDNAEARYRVGLALSRTGDLKNGISQLERALALSPENTRYLYTYSQSLVRVGRFQRAIQAAALAVQLAPDSALYQNGLGSIFMQTGDTARALLQYQEAVRLDPNNPTYIHNLAQTFLKGDMPAEALERFNAVIRMSPASARAYHDRGLAYRDLDKKEQAVESLNQAIILDPDFALAHYNLALIYATEVDPEYTYRFKALEHAQKAVQLSEGKIAAYWMGLAEAWRANRRYHKAISAAQNAIALEPKDDWVAKIEEYKELSVKGFAEKVRPVGANDHDLKIRSLGVEDEKNKDPERD